MFVDSRHIFLLFLFLKKTHKEKNYALKLQLYDQNENQFVIKFFYYKC